MPCFPAVSLLEAVTEAAQKATAGDIVLLSPACSSFDMFQNYEERGEVFRQAVQQVAETTAEERPTISRRPPNLNQEKTERLQQRP